MSNWNTELGDAHRNHRTLSDISLIWTDPPYGTDKVQAGKAGSYRDTFDTRYVVSAILSWLPAMKEDGTVVVCCDYRLAPRLTQAMITSNWIYRGEIIWEFGLGRPRTNWWPVRHNNILTFTKTEESGQFDHEAVPSTKRLAPERGFFGNKPFGSVWDFTMSNTDPERVGYPNQKPLEIITPFILAHTLPNQLVLDPFCGSSSTGVAALKNSRKYHGIDDNPEAIEISNKRLSKITDVEVPLW